jgi:zinc transporter ZupT
MALLFNFLSGTSLMLGVIIIFLTPLSDESIGVILAMSAGVFLFLSLPQLAPRIQSSDFRIKLLSTCVWILGTIPIGLVLLNHQHC